MDFVCGSCLEFKGAASCFLVEDVLTEHQRSTFITEDSFYATNKDNQVYVCVTCKKDILQGKMPKMGKKIQFKYTNFPQDLYEKLKRKCKIVTPPSSRFYDDQNIVEIKALSLNNLEAHLLKQVLPFIRLVHLPRSAHVKVKGSAIFITADIPHSLSKLLPIKQNMIPVAFKRKLEYSGYYLEQVINRDKVLIYFDFLKEQNPLYSHLTFDTDLLEDFEDEIQEDARRFEQETCALFLGVQDENCDADEEKAADITSAVFRQILESDVDEVAEDDVQIAKKAQQCQANVKETILAEEDNKADNDSVIMNKYREELDLPTAVNKLADTIVEYEKAMKIYIKDELYNTDSEYDSEDSCDENKSSTERISNDTLNTGFIVKDEAFLSDESDSEDTGLSSGETQVPFASLFNPTLTQAKTLSKAAKKRSENMIKTLERISVAPGEGGQFVNWSQDVYLEEKMFVELFPYGNIYFLHHNCIIFIIYQIFFL